MKSAYNGICLETIYKIAIIHFEHGMYYWFKNIEILSFNLQSLWVCFLESSKYYIHKFKFIRSTTETYVQQLAF